MLIDSHKPRQPGDQDSYVLGRIAVIDLPAKPCPDRVDSMRRDASRGAEGSVIGNDEYALPAWCLAVARADGLVYAELAVSGGVDLDGQVRYWIAERTTQTEPPRLRFAVLFDRLILALGHGLRRGQQPIRALLVNCMLDGPRDGAIDPRRIVLATGNKFPGQDGLRHGGFWRCGSARAPKSPSVEQSAYAEKRLA